MICMIQRIFLRTINRLYLFIYLFQYCKSKIISSRNNITSLLFTLTQPPFSEQCLVTWTIISWKDDHGHFQKSGMIMDTSSVFFFFFSRESRVLNLGLPLSEDHKLKAQKCDQELINTSGKMDSLLTAT